MKNKKIIPLIIKIVSFIVIIIAIVLAFRIYDTVNVNNNESLISYIEKKENSSNIEIKKKKNYGKLCFLLYTKNNNSYKLIILNRDNIFKNRYCLFGSSGSSFKTDPVEIYIFPQTNYNLVVVFGNNSKLHASKYEIVNNDKILYDENLNVNQYILGVYKIQADDTFSNKVEFFDNEGDRVF